MNRIMRFLTLSAITVLVLTACNFFNTTSPDTSLKLQATPVVTLVSNIALSVQADTSISFNAVNQIVKFSYTIKNNGATSLPGTASVTGATVICPNFNTVGNLDTMFDVNEILICAGTYAITQADLDRGSVINVATANVNGTLSNQVTTTVATVQTKAVTLTKTANPVTYDHVNQEITYTYLIKNNGILTLGPAQFTVIDIGIGIPIKCGDANTTLAPNTTVTCSATYVISQADMNAASVTTNATASGGGAEPSQPVGATITKSIIVQTNPTNPANLVAGSTVQHRVVAGEWLWQIARCYGADPNKVIQANPQLANPAQISPDTTLTVPNVGSVGTIYGPPCVVTHTVQAGDTWSSIAQKYNADVTVLQRVNPVTLSVGTVLKVPRNSAGSPGSVPPTPTVDTRINFAAGTTSATQNGTALSGNRPVHYILNARQGQVMSIKFTAPANSLSIIIYAPNGSTLKPLDLNLTWNGILPANGDYHIDVFNALGPGASDVPYTLEVSVTGN
jgi:LysM repeat protein